MTRPARTGERFIAAHWRAHIRTLFGGAIISRNSAGADTWAQPAPGRTVILETVREAHSIPPPYSRTASPPRPPVEFFDGGSPALLPPNSRSCGPPSTLRPPLSTTHRPHRPRRPRSPTSSEMTTATPLLREYLRRRGIRHPSRRRPTARPPDCTKAHTADGHPASTRSGTGNATPSSGRSTA